VSRDDHDTLDRASFLYDALYTSLQAQIRRAETRG